MRTLRLLVMVAAVAVAGSAMAQHHATTAPKDRDPLAAPYYRMVVKELNLSAEKQDELRKKMKAQDDAMDAWDNSKKGQELADLKKKLDAARKDNNKDEIKKLEADIKPLKEDRAKLDADEHAKVEAFFTADQKPVLVAISRYTGVLGRLSKAGVNLDDGQKAKTMTIAKEYGPKFVAAKDKAEKEKLGKEFYAHVEENVLTADQRAELKAKHEKSSETKPAKTTEHTHVK